jgi:hypothetical protein
MREILFRGRRLANGEWVEGFYFCRDTQHYIKVPVVRNGVVVLTDYEVNPRHHRPIHRPAGQEREAGV